MLKRLLELHFIYLFSIIIVIFITSLCYHYVNVIFQYEDVGSSVTLVLAMEICGLGLGLGLLPRLYRICFTFTWY